MQQYCILVRGFQLSDINLIQIIELLFIKINFLLQLLNGQGWLISCKKQVIFEALGLFMSFGERGWSGHVLLYKVVVYYIFGVVFNLWVRSSLGAFMTFLIAMCLLWAFSFWHGVKKVFKSFFRLVYKILILVV
jgi:hypothetical protein